MFKFNSFERSSLEIQKFKSLLLRITRPSSDALFLHDFEKFHPFLKWFLKSKQKSRTYAKLMMQCLVYQSAITDIKSCYALKKKSMKMHGRAWMIASDCNFTAAARELSVRSNKSTCLNHNSFWNCTMWSILQAKFK